MKKFVRIFFLITAGVGNLSLSSMETNTQQQNTHFFKNASQENTWQRYTLIVSFIEALLGGCKWTLDHHNNFCFKNYYSKKKFRITLEKIFQIAISTEMPNTGLIDLLVNENKDAYKNFISLSFQQQSILLQAWRFETFDKYHLANQLFTVEDVLEYIKNHDDTALKSLDGFNLKLKENRNYLDSYAQQLIQINNNRKDFFKIREKLLKKLRAGENIIFEEEEKALLNKPFFIQFMPLARQHKEILALIQEKAALSKKGTSKEKCFIS